MKVLMAVDGSPFSRKMLLYVASNEKWFRPDFAYVVLHVASTVRQRAASSALLDDAAVYLREQAGFEALKVSRVGKAADVIPEFARRQECNLIVMGSHGYGTLSSLVLGSVTQGVLTSSHVPVLVIR
jgi:nucleotide-binding universal stress UspA family protein